MFGTLPLSLRLETLKSQIPSFVNGYVAGVLDVSPELNASTPRHQIVKKGKELAKRLIVEELANKFYQRSFHKPRKSRKS